MILRFFVLFLIILNYLVVVQVGIIGLGIVNLNNLLLSLLGFAFRINILANQVVSDIDVLVIAAFLEQVDSARRLHFDYARVTALKLWHFLHAILLATARCFSAI